VSLRTVFRPCGVVRSRRCVSSPEQLFLSFHQEDEIICPLIRKKTVHASEIIALVAGRTKKSFPLSEKTWSRDQDSSPPGMLPPFRLGAARARSGFPVRNDKTGAGYFAALRMTPSVPNGRCLTCRPARTQLSVVPSERSGLALACRPDDRLFGVRNSSSLDTTTI